MCRIRSFADAEAANVPIQHLKQIAVNYCNQMLFISTPTVSERDQTVLIDWIVTILYNLIDLLQQSVED